MIAFLRRRPEWWILALAAAAWIAAAIGAIRPRHHHDEGAFDQWMLMVVAMMLPLLVAPVRATAARSLWRRRHRAIAAFLAGYLVVWAAAGAVLAIAMDELASVVRPVSWWALAAFAVAAVWHVTPRRRRAVVSCHGTAPLAPLGWRATRDDVRYGAVIGGRCLLSCGPLMIACALSGHRIAMMAALMLLIGRERYEWRPSVVWRSPAARAHRRPRLTMASTGARP